jgi:hypothetical protein
VTWMAQTPLNAAERETVVLTSDADDTWTLTTHQRKVITKLRNAGWEPVEDLHYAGQPGYRFTVPYSAITIRSRASVEKVLTPEERAARRKQGERLANRSRNGES